MNYRVGSRTDIGRARERNEDSMLVKEPLFAVADGMGGHRGGDVASALVEKIKAVNRAVLDRGAAEGALRGMGTTLTAVLTDGDRAHVAHVGDSRAYLHRDGVLQRLTEDHTLVQRMVREGKITADQAERHPQRSVLTRALGVEEDLPVDELTLDMHPGDRILICSDGLTGMLDEERIGEILESEPDPQGACDRLVEEANGAGGEDNITVILIEAHDGDEGENDKGNTGRTATAAPVADGPTATKEPAAPAGGRAEGARPGRRRRRTILALAVAALVVIAGIVGVRIYLSRQWYVGDSDGKVAIYNGIPAKVLGFELSHVEETTGLPATRAEQLQPWHDLGDGITAGSLEEARSIVDQIERDLGQSAGASG
ncbi:MAG: serine/threonine-protein phosphatase [Actinobacteria bacterium]|nr:MAG: serine/threonine-protein phosphatase [Actinomycetota bacterium]